VPSPFTKLNTPGGKPASSINDAIIKADNGANYQKKIVKVSLVLNRNNYQPLMASKQRCNRLPTPPQPSTQSDSPANSTALSNHTRQSALLSHDALPIPFRQSHFATSIAIDHDQNKKNGGSFTFSILTTGSSNLNLLKIVQKLLACSKPVLVLVLKQQHLLST
jgi:hypothetical protein